MKFSPSIFAVPATLVALLLLANCSSDPAPAPPASAGSTSAAAGSAGKAGVAGAGGSAGGAGGASAGGPSAGGSNAGASTAGAGTAGAGTAGGAAVDASFATVRAVIGSKCNGGNGCHGQEGNPLPMANDDKLYATMIAHTTEYCGKLINTASPADSALVKLMLADCGTAPKLTYRMPRQQCWDGDKPEENEACVPTATVAAIQAWIAKGAPQQ